MNTDTGFRMDFEVQKLTRSCSDKKRRHYPKRSNPYYFPKFRVVADITPEGVGSVIYNLDKERCASSSLAQACYEELSKAVAAHKWKNVNRYVVFDVTLHCYRYQSENWFSVVDTNDHYLNQDGSACYLCRDDPEFKKVIKKIEKRIQADERAAKK